MDNKNPNSFSDEVGKQLGKLFVLSMYQAKATVVLANAIKNDPTVSQKTKDKANETLEVIDKIIEHIESAMSDPEGSIPLRDFVVSVDE